MSVVHCLLLVMTMFASTVLLQAGTVFNVYSSDSKRSSDKVIGGVAFSVGRSTVFEASQLSRVLMNHEFYNKGGYFDMQKGIFTAPVSGVYAFSFGASSKSNKQVNMDLYAGNPEKSVARTYNYNTQHGHASGFVMIEMKKGDHASIWLNRGMAINPQTPPSTYFSGYLVTELKTEC